MNDNKNKGMLLGFINIIDFIVLIGIILLVIAIYFYKAKTNTDVPVVLSVPVKVSFYAETVPSFVADAIEIGGRLEDVQKRTYLGNIEEINISEGYVYFDDGLAFHIDSNKKLNKMYKEDYNSIELITTVQGQPSTTGIIIDGARYLVGHSITFRAGDGNIYGKISGLEIIE